MFENATIFEQVIKPAFIAVVGAEPHRGAAIEGVPPDAWSGLYRHSRDRRFHVEPLVVTVDLDATGGVVVVHRAYENEGVIAPLRPGTNLTDLCNTMNKALVNRLTDPSGPVRPRTA